MRNASITCQQKDLEKVEQAMRRLYWKTKDPSWNEQASHIFDIRKKLFGDSWVERIRQQERGLLAR